MSKDKAYLDKEISMLNLLPPNLALEETTACNILKHIADWLSLLNHNYNIDNTAPPLLYGAFFKLANLIADKEYKTWYGRFVYKDPWIPLQHVDQLQWIMSGVSKLTNTPALIHQVLAGRPLDLAPFVHIYNAAADLI
eukprot:10114740-Ditylum_brightwellii.AAC.1